MPDPPALAAQDDDLSRKRKLALILEHRADDSQDAAAARDSDDDDTMDADDADLAETTHVDGLCVECQDHPAQLHCAGCAEDYCNECWTAQHKKGRSRARHATTPIHQDDADSNRPASSATASATTSTVSGIDPTAIAAAAVAPGPDNGPQRAADLGLTPTITPDANAFGEWLAERVQWIPVRLTLDERKLLRLLDAALRVSEYTDKVDILTYTSRAKRIVAQIRELCQILSGLVLAADYKTGQELFQDRDFAANAAWFQHVFEIGRRHKICNPEKFRSSYGKLLYLLQDSALPEVQNMLGFSCIMPIKTVHRVLEEHGALALLKDAAVWDATSEIVPDGKTRRQIDAEIRRKERAVETLAKKYATRSLSPEMIRQLLYSIGDHHHYLRFHRDPCDRMLRYLTTHFSSENGTTPSLAIRAGAGGARLSHSHSKQFAYVFQSLVMWREVAHDMFMLWALAEDDMLASGANTYRLRDTGQGLNRVQPCPKAGRAMHAILRRAQSRVGGPANWVGSSVIHLGDHNVPNALMLIDKYTQVPRILAPVLQALDKLGDVAANPALRAYLANAEFAPRGETDPSALVDAARKAILTDFFQHAFDGSGADNFNSAGSCIDGRLTSAWNWCSQIEKKAYFPVFLLTGYIGFDGEHFDV
ncbi:hypothetical protein GGF31_005248 [Allomyces arbusculus]|nr:hypothetical protein GGF31_005248 [Allomyces arbusculus]